MCSYITELIAVQGSGKGRSGWFDLTDASVYVDHPVAAQAEHTLNIDFRNPELGPSARAAVESTSESSLALVEAIHTSLAAVSEGLLAHG